MAATPRYTPHHVAHDLVPRHPGSSHEEALHSHSHVAGSHEDILHMAAKEMPGCENYGIFFRSYNGINWFLGGKCRYVPSSRKRVHEVTL